MNKKKIKKIATWIIVPLMAAIFALDILTVALSNTYCRRYSVEQESFGGENGDDRIHFLNTANSDAILVYTCMITYQSNNVNPVLPWNCEQFVNNSFAKHLSGFCLVHLIFIAMKPTFPPEFTALILFAKSRSSAWTSRAKSMRLPYQLR